MKTTSDAIPQLAGMDCSRILIDCPRCGAKPPIAHDLGGGPRFAGVRTCGNGCGTWDDDDRQNWGYIHSQNTPVSQPGNDSENLSGRGTGLAAMDC